MPCYRFGCFTYCHKPTPWHDWWISNWFLPSKCLDLPTDLHSILLSPIKTVRDYNLGDLGSRILLDKAVLCEKFRGTGSKTTRWLTTTYRLLSCLDGWRVCSLTYLPNCWPLYRREDVDGDRTDCIYVKSWDQHLRLLKSSVELYEIGLQNHQYLTMTFCIEKLQLSHLFLGR